MTNVEKKEVRKVLASLSSERAREILLRKLAAKRTPLTKVSVLDKALKSAMVEAMRETYAFTKMKGKVNRLRNEGGADGGYEAEDYISMGSLQRSGKRFSNAKLAALVKLIVDNTYRSSQLYVLRQQPKDFDYDSIEAKTLALQKEYLDKENIYLRVVALYFSPGNSNNPEKGGPLDLGAFGLEHTVTVLATAEVYKDVIEVFSESLSASSEVDLAKQVAKLVKKAVAKLVG